MQRKRKLKLKYSIELLGLYDYYGRANSQARQVKWMTENCVGKWNYGSPDVKTTKYSGKAPENWPKFYSMTFYFSRKKDYEKFKKRFT